MILTFDECNANVGTTAKDIKINLHENQEYQYISVN